MRIPSRPAGFPLPNSTQEGAPVIVLIGHSAAKEAYRDSKGKLLHRAAEGNRVTTVVIPDNYSIVEMIHNIMSGDGVWNNHSQGDDPRDSSADWVEVPGEDPRAESLASAIAGELGAKVGRPKTWKQDA
jgi:hypothetical protein